MSRQLGPVTVQGRALRCMVCSHDVFWEQHITVSAGMFSFLDPDSTAHCAVCERCGYVHMFLPKATVDVDEKTPAPAAPAAPA
jgi:hypothetical protein